MLALRWPAANSHLRMLHCSISDLAIMIKSKQSQVLQVRCEKVWVVETQRGAQRRRIEKRRPHHVSPNPCCAAVMA